MDPLQSRVMFDQFIGFCSSHLESHTHDDDTELKKVICVRYNGCKEEYKQSHDFAQLLDKTKEIISLQPSRVFVHLKDFLTELKAYQREPSKGNIVYNRDCGKKRERKRRRRERSGETDNRQKRCKLAKNNHHEEDNSLREEPDVIIILDSQETDTSEAEADVKAEKMEDSAGIKNVVATIGEAEKGSSKNDLDSDSERDVPSPFEIIPTIMNIGSRISSPERVESSAESETTDTDDEHNVTVIMLDDSDSDSFSKMNTVIKTNYKKPARRRLNPVKKHSPFLDKKPGPLVTCSKPVTNVFTASASAPETDAANISGASNNNKVNLNAIDSMKFTGDISTTTTNAVLPFNDSENKVDASILGAAMPSTSETIDAEKADPSGKSRKGSDRQIKRLEKLLQDIKNKIEDLKEKEMSLDDLDQEDSSYMYEDKLQKKFVQVWNKLCQLKGRSKTTGRPSERRFKFKGTRYPEVNRKIERFINGKKTFPDFHDIKKMILRTKIKHRLPLSKNAIDSLAREVFADVGNQLQERRHEDNASTFGCRLTDNMSHDEDPSVYDPELRRQLDHNKTIAKTNMDKVMEKYAQKQYEDGEEAEDVRSDDDVLERVRASDEKELEIPELPEDFDDGIDDIDSPALSESGSNPSPSSSTVTINKDEAETLPQCDVSKPIETAVCSTNEDELPQDKSANSKEEIDQAEKLLNSNQKRRIKDNFKKLKLKLHQAGVSIPKKANQIGSVIRKSTSGKAFPGNVNVTNDIQNPSPGSDIVILSDGDASPGVSSSNNLSKKSGKMPVKRQLFSNKNKSSTNKTAANIKTNVGAIQKTSNTVLDDLINDQIKSCKLVFPKLNSTNNAGLVKSESSSACEDAKPAAKATKVNGLAVQLCLQDKCDLKVSKPETICKEETNISPKDARGTKIAKCPVDTSAIIVLSDDDE